MVEARFILEETIVLIFLANEPSERAKIRGTIKEVTSDK